jgi:hypothetical protein
MSAAHETEDQLIHRAQQALSRCNWEIGECAAQWTTKFARGRTDGDFGALIGLSGDQVYQRRRVWETFSDVHDQYSQLKWSHFYAAINWDDSAECLQWANDMGATVAEMKAWRRAQRGEDLSQPAAEEPPFGVEASPEFLTVGAGYVQDVDDDSGRAGFARAERSGNGLEERGAVATAVAREAEAGEYAPYGKGARGPAPGEGRSQSSAPPLQVLKRITTALERVDASITPEIIEAFPESPIALQQRFLSSVENLIAKTRGLS